MDYDKLFEDALRSVVQTVLTRVIKEGLLGDHHFYISFQTNHAGVSIPDSLRARYPDEMTIVLQNQFWDLKVTDELFEVTLSFNDMQEQVVVPFKAITSFVDPSVRFGLQFRGGKESEGGAILPQEGIPQPRPETATKDKGGKATSDQTEDDTTAEVIPLDTFRKK